MTRPTIKTNVTVRFLTETPWIIKTKNWLNSGNICTCTKEGMFFAECVCLSLYITTQKPIDRFFMT